MKTNLILPKNGVLLELWKSDHVYFLAGPIRGGGDWQAKAIRMLAEKDPGCFIVCPCRYIEQQHELCKYSLPATETPTLDDEPKNPEHILTFPNQTLWERYYLKIASKKGCIIFWLPEEDKENPRKKEDGPYARDTYGELGRWSIKSSEESTTKLVVGAEKNFPGLSVIQTNFDADHERMFTIYPTLEETITQAVKFANQ